VCVVAHPRCTATSIDFHQRVPEISLPAATSFFPLSVAASTSGFPKNNGSSYQILSVTCSGLYQQVPELSPEATTIFSRLPVCASTSGFQNYPRQLLPYSLGYE
jgi:hypothetical protein